MKQKGLILGDTDMRTFLAGTMRGLVVPMKRQPPASATHPPFNILFSSGSTREGCWRWTEHLDHMSQEIHVARPPLGCYGDRLWVREAWACDPNSPSRTLYKADRERGDQSVVWKRAATLPRAMARPVALIINMVRPYRLMDVPDDHIKRIGCTDHEDEAVRRFHFNAYFLTKNPKCRYEENPWVWTYGFDVEGLT